jgi:hypothetical protein
MNAWTLSVTIAVACASMVVQAHHSIAGVYDTSRQVTVEGVVTAFRFVNPHPFLVIDVRDTAQKPQPWRLEVDNRWELVEIGVTAETWKAGDWVVVTGSRVAGKRRVCTCARSIGPRTAFATSRSPAGREFVPRRGDFGQQPGASLFGLARPSATGVTST